MGAGLAGVFVVGGLVVREVRCSTTRSRAVLDHADQGSWPLLVLVTSVNGVAEELFFRGALYAAVPRYPVAVTTVAYALATLATGNVDAGLRRGRCSALVVGLERRPPAGILAPILTHVHLVGRDAVRRCRALLVGSALGSSARRTASA